MNNIYELVEIIKNLGGSATVDEILTSYLSIHCMIQVASYKQVIQRTLQKYNKQSVYYDESNDLWSLAKVPNSGLDGKTIKKPKSLNGKKVLDSYYEMIDYLKGRYVVTLKYDRISNPSGAHTSDVCYWFGYNKANKLGFLYCANDRSRQRYASFEPDPKYFTDKNIDLSGFYKIQDRETWPQKKMFFRDYATVKEAIAQICDDMDKNHPFKA